MKDIIQDPDPVLRQAAAAVPVSEITTKKIQGIVAAMQEALANEEDGVAIAAPQIGVSMRLFVVSKKVLKDAPADMVFINPELIRLGKQKKFVHEGCLSVRWKYGLVKRATTATVRAYNMQGNQFQMSARGLLAQVFQHETDHLDGILFIDSAKEIEDIPPHHEPHTV
ncbi:MAG TPA: peptide deformylase [Candidatus Paceibacterota bacterium]|nr:peptide deformylase [Candidatus Paceibacterota bacterium]